MLSKLFGKKLTRERFAAAFRRRLEEIPGVSEVSYEPEGFLIRYRKDGKESIANLGNAFADAGHSGLDEVIDKYTKALAQDRNEEVSLEEARANLLPMVRDPAYFGISNLSMRIRFPESDVNSIPRAQVAPGVEVAIALDSEHSVATVSQDQLDRWQLSFDAALRIAVDNLRDRTLANFENLGNGLFLSQWHDVYDASRILLTDMLYRLPLHGEPVVGIPSRNHLIVAGAADAEALQGLADLVADGLEQDSRPMCPLLLRLDQNVWVPFDDTAVDSGRLARARYKLQKQDYDQQKQLLDALHEREGVDLFVASFGLHEDTASKAWFTQTQLTKGVDTLLPRADRLLLLDMEAEEVVILPWEGAVQVLGAKLKPTALAPERYAVNEFPAEGDWQLARSLALHVGRLGK